MNQNIKRAGILSLFCVSALAVFCQTSFTMTKDKGHYYINTVVNGHDSVWVFVESGIPGLFINEENYMSLFDDSLYEKVDSKYSNVRFSHSSYKIIQVLRGKVLVGDLSYQGDIYVLDKYEKTAIPVHLLKNEKDSTENMIRFNFKNQTLEFVGNDVVKTNKMHQYKMTEYNPMPVIESTFSLSDEQGNNGLITGKFVFDLGNSSPLFITTRNPDMLRFIKNNKFKISTAQDRYTGETIGHGIFATLCRIGKRTARNVSIGISNKISIGNTMGFIGPSLFDKGDVIIDTKNNSIYYE
jgi:hypothetical protein